LPFACPGTTTVSRTFDLVQSDDARARSGSHEDDMLSPSWIVNGFDVLAQ
jgi:hypothetical protein